MAERSCVGCGRTGEKSALVRLAAFGGRLVIDKKGVLKGRGAYLCRSAACVKQAYRKKGAFGRALKTSVVLPDMEELIGFFQDPQERN
ncbi:MAG: YlxR family protein [Deltaproteobacteria bacterium]|nr:YlxR family protein [Deltaproteobacteria bacterium]MBI5810214.1 YlxR family protein [Deltaproteobacteria bacterium]